MYLSPTFSACQSVANHVVVSSSLSRGSVSHRRVAQLVPSFCFKNWLNQLSLLYLTVFLHLGLAKYCNNLRFLYSSFWCQTLCVAGTLTYSMVFTIWCDCLLTWLLQGCNLNRSQSYCCQFLLRSACVRHFLTNRASVLEIVALDIVFRICSLPPVRIERFPQMITVWYWYKHQTIFISF